MIERQTCFEPGLGEYAAMHAKGRQLFDRFFPADFEQVTNQVFPQACGSHYEGLPTRPERLP